MSAERCQYAEYVHKRWTASMAEHRTERLTFEDVHQVSALAERVERLERENRELVEALRRIKYIADHFDTGEGMHANVGDLRRELGAALARATGPAAKEGV